MPSSAPPPSSGTQFPLNLADGDSAPLSFSIDDNKNSSDAFTLLLDLRQSLSFDDDNEEYTLTPMMRAVETSEMSRIDGNVSVTCPDRRLAGTRRGLSVPGPATSHPTTSTAPASSRSPPRPCSPATTGGSFFYSLRYLPAGDYTLAVTCSGNDEDPSTDEDLQFRNVVNVSLDDSETITRDLP